MNVFLISTIISVVYLIIKFTEMRMFDKENKPLKVLIRDTLIVYFSVIIGYFFIDQLKPFMLQEGVNTVINPQVFTDNPNF